MQVQTSFAPFAATSSVHVSMNIFMSIWFWYANNKDLINILQLKFLRNIQFNMLISKYGSAFKVMNKYADTVLLC